MNPSHPAEDEGHKRIQMVFQQVPTFRNLLVTKIEVVMRQPCILNYIILFGV